MACIQIILLILSLRKNYGVSAISAMCTFTIEHINGTSLWAKSQIIILGKLDQHTWFKSGCFSLVVSIPMIWLLTALAVKNNRTLKQSNYKFTFIQASLPHEELNIVETPIGCSFSSSSQYWKLEKTLYGLHHAPHHWFELLSSTLQSPVIALKPCKNDPCIFHGTILDGNLPIYLVVNADDLLY